MASLARRLQKEGLPLGTLLRSAVASQGGELGPLRSRVAGAILNQPLQGTTTSLRHMSRLTQLSCAEARSALPEADEQKTAEVKFRVLMEAPPDAREASLTQSLQHTASSTQL